MTDSRHPLDERADTWGRQLGSHPYVRTLGWALAVTIIVLVVVGVVGLVSTGSVLFTAAQARVTAPARVTTKVYDPDNIINQVAFFTTTCEDVGRDYANWRNNQANYDRELSIVQASTNAGQQAEALGNAQQLSQYVAGSIEQLQQDAAAYNARSINYTANPFKSASLPYRIQVPAAPAELSTWTPPTCG